MNVLGFILSGAGLLLLSEIEPQLAIMVGGVMIVGYVLINPQALTNLSSLISGK